MAMANPVHPGEIFSEEVLKPLEISVTEAAAMLGVSRQALSALVNTRADLSPEMAFRIEKAFGPKADLMMRLQNAHSMAHAKRRQKEILRACASSVREDKQRTQRKFMHNLGDGKARVSF